MRGNTWCDSSEDQSGSGSSGCHRESKSTAESDARTFHSLAMQPRSAGITLA